VNKTYLLFKHEFIQSIKKAGYIILTLIVPVLALMTIGLVELISTVTEPPEMEIPAIGFVDEINMIAIQTDQEQSIFLPFPTQDEATRALIAGEISEFIIIPSDYLYSGKIKRFSQTTELVTNPSTIYMINTFLTTNLLMDHAPPEVIDTVVTPLNLEIIRLNENGEVAEGQGFIGNIIIPGIFAFLLSMAFMFGSNSLISGLGEEKESRLIEVLYTSVSVPQLLIGKILALGAAGMLQVFFWLLSTPFILNLAANRFGGFLTQIQLPTNFILLGIVYFVLGYLLFAILSITIGGISPSANEGHNLSMFYIMATYIPLWTIGLLINYPENPVWIVLSLFPVTAPIQMMVRLGISDIPFWQIPASIGILLITIAGGLYLSTKVFRVFMLMYGKRPRLPEIIRGLKNS
jgi:ABC-2 type transport system permease protein